VLPLLAPAIAAASSIVFLFTFTSFGVVLILGGLRYRTLEVEIWRQAIGLFYLQTATVIAVFQMALVAAFLGAFTLWQRRSTRRLGFVPESHSLVAPSGLRRIGVVAATTGTAAALLLPLGVLTFRSFEGHGAGWRLLVTGGRGVEPAVAIANSLRYALVATVLAATIGTVASVVVARGKSRWARVFDVGLMLPLGT